MHNHFLKLSTNVINKLHNIQITKYPSKYYIYTSINDIGGFIFFSFGNLSTGNNYIEICEEKNKQDYDIVTNFMNEIK